MKNSMGRPICHVVFAGAVVWAGCASQKQSTPEAQVDSIAVHDAVEEIWREYSASLNASDLDRWLSLWTDDGVQMPPDEPPVVGKDRIRERNQGFLDLFDFDMSITNQEVVATSDWAYSRGVYEATLTPKERGDPLHVDGKYMTILSRQSDGSWKIHRDIFNSNAAPTN